MASSHFERGMCVSSKIVPTRAENWRRQAAHFQTRRGLTLPALVLRLPMKYAFSVLPQCGQTGPSGQRIDSISFQASASSEKCFARLARLISLVSMAQTYLLGVSNSNPKGTLNQN